MSAELGKKFSEIYSSNEKSPVFLRIAERQIEEKEYEKAIEILKAALTGNSVNAAIFFLLGKAYTGIGDFKEALMNFKKGSEIIRSDKTFQYYLKEIELQKRRKDQKDISIPKIGSSDYSSLLENSDSNSTKDSPAAKTDVDDNLISETLAQIYLSQSETGEAVKVYEKLIRKYPLKKLYFEAKIAEITSGMK